MKALEVWFEDGNICILTDDNRKGYLPLRLYAKLYNATDEQRQEFTLSPFGIHWEKLDEDLSFEGFFHPYNHPNNPNPIGNFFFRYPEFNVRQVAKSIGINSTLLQQYIDGYKTPSAQRTQQIEDAIHRLGKELQEIKLK